MAPVNNPLDHAFLTNDPTATELILVRHGQQDLPDYGTSTIAQSVDAPLSAIGKEQARLVGERFRAERVDVVYASNLQRAYDTAAAIGSHHGLTPIIDEDLREIEVFRDIDPHKRPVDVFGRQRLLGVRSHMARTQRWDVYPMSEPSAEFTKRVVNAIEGILTDHDGQRIVIGCHGGVISSYLAWVVGIDRDMWFRPAHASVHVLRGKGQTRALQSINDVHHLLGFEPTLHTH